MNLLRTPEEKAGRPRRVLANGGGREAARTGAVKVLEHTPQAKGGVKRSSRGSEVSLKAQVAALEKERRGLALKVSGRGERRLR